MKALLSTPPPPGISREVEPEGFEKVKAKRMQQEHAEKLEKFLAGVEELAKLTPEHRGLLMQLLLLEVYRDKQRISGSGRKRWLHIVYTGRIAAKKEGGDAGELSAVFTRGDVVEIEDGLLKGHGEGLILVAQGICQVLQVPLIEGNVDSDDDDEEEEAWAEPCLEEDEDEDEEAEGEEEKEGEDEDEESEKDDMEASNRRMKQLERDLPRRVVIGENGWSVDCRPPVNNQEDRQMKLRSLFNWVDRDQNGSISRSELDWLVGELGMGFVEEDMRIAFDEADVEHHGEITFAEFSNWWEGLNMFQAVGVDKSQEINEEREINWHRSKWSLPVPGRRQDRRPAPGLARALAGGSPLSRSTSVSDSYAENFLRAQAPSVSVRVSNRSGGFTRSPSA